MKAQGPDKLLVAAAVTLGAVLAVVTWGAGGWRGGSGRTAAPVRRPGRMAASVQPDRALCPVQGFLLAEHRQRTMLKNIHPLRWGSAVKVPSGYLHALRLFPFVRRLTPEDLPDYEAILACFLDDRRYREGFGSPLPMLVPTVFGAAYRTSSRSRSPDFALGHVDDFLAVAAEIGLTLDTPIHPLGGGDRATHTLRAVLLDSLSRWRADRELAFSAVAYSKYLVGTPTWVTRWGTRGSLDQCARLLAQSDLGTGTCAGTHTLYAAVALLRTDQAHQGLLAPATRNHLEHRLRQAAKRLSRHQHPDGSWGADWAGQIGGANYYQDAEKERLAVTGHHLEWIALAPPELRPPNGVTRKALSYLVELLLPAPQRTACLLPEVESVYRFNYTEATHAVRALLLLAQAHCDGVPNGLGPAAPERRTARHRFGAKPSVAPNPPVNGGCI